jgi:sterol 24-C-methyltransferase
MTMHQTTNGSGAEGLKRDEVAKTMESYAGTFDASHKEQTHGEHYATLTTQFYDLVTDFYEFGWGQSFHFAVRRRGEAFQESIERHAVYLGERLGVGPRSKVVDLGCGVGGPMRNIVRATGAHVTGVNINGYQVAKTRKYNQRAGLAGLTDVVEADYLKVPFPAETFDAAYGIEALCHAPDKNVLYKEVNRLLKPGARFAMYEWCITPSHDENNPEHAQVRFGIEKGNALSRLSTFEEVHEALAANGFEVLEARDRALEGEKDIAWWTGLDEVSVKNLPRTKAGRAITNLLTGALEKVRIAPKGTQAVSSFLNSAADALVAGGKLGTFTPMYFVVARKVK